MYLGQIQLHPTYKRQLDSAFLKWYPHNFSKRKNIYYHWSAGPYNAVFDDYHYNIKGDGDVVLTFEGNPFQDIKAHTYARNHDAVGIGVCCMSGASTQNYGSCPPTKEQILKSIELLANICCNYRIAVGYILSHEEAADNMDYSSMYDEAAPHTPYGIMSSDFERWDWFCWLNPENFKLKTASGKKGKIDPPPEGWIYVMDYLRGETALKIQEMTRKYWHPENGKGL